jgi:hypothetical protein
MVNSEEWSRGQWASLAPIFASMDEMKSGSRRGPIPAIVYKTSHGEIGSGAQPSQTKWRAAKAPCAFADASLIQFEAIPSSRLTQVT